MFGPVIKYVEYLLESKKISFVTKFKSSYKHIKG